MPPDDAVHDAYVAHYPDLFHFVRHKLRGDSEAADLAQESFLRWLDFIRSTNAAILDPRGFLFRVARNLMNDRWRSRRRQAALRDHGLLTDDRTPAASPDGEAEQRQRLALLIQAVQELPSKCREAFTLHKFHGLSHEAVAARMGISRNMVEKHVIRAMRDIRSRIEPQAWRVAGELNRAGLDARCLVALGIPNTLRCQEGIGWPDPDAAWRPG